MTTQDTAQPQTHPPTPKITILLVNPNSTSSMTTACLLILQPSTPPDVAVQGFTPAAPAPTAIESQVDNVLSSAATFRQLLPLLSQNNESQPQTQNQSQPYPDAILVACFSDHHLTRMLREELSLPAIGIMEASLFYARTLGARIGIIATSARSAIAHWDSVRRYGFADSCAGIRACELGVLELESLPRERVLARMGEVARALVEVDGADVLVLGCAGMAEMKAAVEEVVDGLGVQVVDGVVAGLQHLVGVVRMGGRTAKRGVWRSSEAARKARGQDFL